MLRRRILPINLRNKWQVTYPKPISNLIRKKRNHLVFRLPWSWNNSKKSKTYCLSVSNSWNENVTPLTPRHSSPHKSKEKKDLKCRQEKENCRKRYKSSKITLIGRSICCSIMNRSISNMRRCLENLYLIRIPMSQSRIISEKRLNRKSFLFLKTSARFQTLSSIIKRKVKC